MDKETLSNYGWIVICILISSVMIALATPFGEYIGNAVKSTTEGLFKVEQNALGAAGLIIDDQGFEDNDGGSTPEPVPVVDSATFSDGIILTWEELMLEENGLKYGYGGRLGNMYLGTGIDESGIAENVFDGCTSLTGIVIPDSCYSIDECAFARCTNLTTVYIPDSIREIHERTFAGCSSLTSIDIHSGITSIDYFAFADSNLSTINYAGTTAQWNNITKSDNWNLNCREITVHCTDGTLIEVSSDLFD